MAAEDNQPFLSLVAGDLIKRFGTNLAKVAVVFPGQRARLFFNNYLYLQAGTPVWAPRYLSIEELFQQETPLRQADPILLICELYKTYIEVYNKYASSPSTETFDEFFFFGEILLNDFDDVDKNLVNARSLFQNLEDLDQLRDDFSHLSESQTETLSKYLKFRGETFLQKAFRSIWNLLGEVYFSYREKLKKENLAYPGMLMREAIESESVAYPFEHYVFVGFNVLNKCEEKLFGRLKEKALYYWDVDAYYFHKNIDLGNEAGRFIEKNIRKFGSALDTDLFDNFLDTEKQITLIASPSESGQSAYIAPWITSLKQPESFTAPDTAIVLCNEKLLPPVMHAIPSQLVENVNITMGFPLAQTPVCSFLHVLAEMQVKGYVESGRSFRYKYILPVLRHPYTKSIFPEAGEVEKELVQGNIFFPTISSLRDKELFAHTPDTASLAGYLLQMITRIGESFREENEFTDIYGGLYQESVFRAYQVINRLYGLLASGELTLEKSTFLRLMRKLFSTTKIPFHGEPVKGLQIMGVLETRNLDFKNLIMLSTNEGFMPGTDSDNSFIPQFIRKHFELSTTEHQDSIYAYYFYRLIQRAKNITLIYNTDKTQTGKAEMSRFLLQLLIDPRLNIKRYSLQASVKPLESEPVEVPKSNELMQRIKFKYDLRTNPGAKILSPSALNVFIDCSLRFYLQYVEGLKSEEELTDELDSSVFGTIFHRAAELLYREIGGIGDAKAFIPFVVKKEQLDLITKNQYWIDKLVAKAFSDKYFKGKEINPKQYNGEQLIKFRVIRHLLKRLIAFDKRQAPFTIMGLEQQVEAEFELPGQQVSLRIGGVIDRMDNKADALYIVDYKTSGTGKSYKTMDDLVVPKDTRASHVFQTFVYASILIKRNRTNLPVIPCLVYLQEANKEDFSPVITYEKEPICDFNNHYQAFNDIFTNKISELFNQDTPFRQTTVVSKCSYCDFKALCNR